MTVTGQGTEQWCNRVDSSPGEDCVYLSVVGSFLTCLIRSGGNSE